MPNTARKTKITAGYALYFPWVLSLVYQHGHKYWYHLSPGGYLRAGEIGLLECPSGLGNLWAAVLRMLSRSTDVLPLLSPALSPSSSQSQLSRSRSRKQARCCCFTHSLCAHTIVCVLFYFFQVNSKTADNQRNPKRNQTNLCKLQAWQLQRHNNNEK